MDRASEVPLRPDWMFEVASVCQVFFGRTFDADRQEFREALELLQKELPEPASALESALLRERLITCTLASGTSFHLRYHTQVSLRPCPLSPCETSSRVWSQHRKEPHVLLGEWSDAFFSAFDKDHPWPAAERAAAVIRKQFSEPFDLTELSRQVGSARSTLTRAFRGRYGMSMRAYQTDARLRWAVTELRRPDSNVESVALRAGWSPSKFYAALRAQTGMTPTEIRAMSYVAPGFSPASQTPARG